MSKLSLILSGVAAYLLLRGRGDSIFTKVTANIKLDYYLNSGVLLVQKGTLTITNTSATDIEIQSLSLIPSDVQLTQSGKVLNIDETTFFATIGHDGKFFRDSISGQPLMLKAKSSLTFDIGITSFMYEPADNPLIVTTNFERSPFSALFMLSLNTNRGDYAYEVTAAYSNIRGDE